jgi:hypothetical protein
MSTSEFRCKSREEQEFWKRAYLTVLGRTIEEDGVASDDTAYYATLTANAAVESLRKVFRPIPVCGGVVDVGVDDGKEHICIRQIGHKGQCREKK